MKAPARPEDIDDIDALLVRSGTGDDTAFAELYDRIAPRVFGLACCLVQDAEAAEGLARDCFVEAWRRAATYDPRSSSATAWVLAIARGLAVPASRASARRPCASEAAHQAYLLDAGLTPAEARAVRLAWCDGLHHARITSLHRDDAPAPELITRGLRALMPAGSG